MGRSRKANSDNLADVISGILDEYEQDVANNIEDVTRKVANATAVKLRHKSKEAVGGTGKYAKGWGVYNDHKSLVKKSVVHHKSMPGLPHLLEHGHISVVNGKRVGQAKPHPHIEPIEEEAIELYEKEILEKLK